MSDAPEDHPIPPCETPVPVDSPESPPVNRWLEWLLCTVLLLGSLGLFLAFAWPLIQGRLYVEDDLAALYLPIRDFYAKCLREGYNFLWMPHLANGFYIHGEGHGGFLHPLHFLLYRIFPLNQAFMGEVLVSYPIMWLGTCVFLRRWKLPWSASLLGALLMTLIGCSMNHYVHISFIAVMAHLPWALLVIDIVMRTDSPYRRTWAIGACILLSASQIYIGNPQVLYFSWLVEMFYALLLLGMTRRIVPLLHLGVTKVLALAIGAAQLLPTLAAYQTSLRQDPGLDYQLGISLHPWNLLQLISPYLFHKRVYAPLSGDEPWDAPYLGAAMLPLLLLLVMQLFSMKQRRVLAIAALALALFGILAVLGKYGFIYQVLTRIPVVNFFRAPARYVAVLHVALAIVGALSFSLLLRIVLNQTVLSWKRLAPIVLIPALSLGVLACVVGYRALNEGDALTTFNHHVMRNAAVALGTALVCIASGLVLAAARGRAWALVLLALLLIADTGLYSLRHKTSQTLPKVMAAIPLPPGDNTHRIEPNIVPYTMNQVALHGYRNVTGYLNLFPETYLDYAQPGPMQLAGVQWRESRFGTSVKLHSAKEAGIDWIELDDPMPRLRLVNKAVVTTDPMADLGNIDMETTALLFKAVSLDDNPPGSVVVQRDTPGHIEVKTDTQGSQLLVLSENHHPGWWAHIDGVPTRVLRVYGDFMGCVVPAGQHNIRFFFWPEDLTRGVLITGAALLLSLLYLILSCRVSLRRRQAAANET
ncbi:MAG: YfhO family protein [Candidatus Hydrogenedentes bacterium]|nr:YfhO family protein [Candidatus Hydrogenedentota bacterium]